MVEKIHAYILDHDNRWSFIIAYISLAVVLAIVLNLFWLAVVVAIHGLFEWITQLQYTKDKLAILSRVLWELKLDFGLILFGLALEVYMGFLLGVVGLGAAARAGVATGSRFAVLQNVLRGTLLSLDDAAQVVRMVGNRSDSDGTDGEIDILDGPEVDLPEPEAALDGGRLGPWRQKYSLGAKFSLGFGAFFLLLILLAPYLVPEHDWSSVLAAIGEEMHPWPW